MAIVGLIVLVLALAVVIGLLWLAMEGMRRDDAQVSDWTAHVLDRVHEEQRQAALRRLRPGNTGLDDRPRASFSQPAKKGFVVGVPRDPVVGMDQIDAAQRRQWTDRKDMN